MSVVLKMSMLDLAEPYWFLAWTQTKSSAGSEKWSRRIKPLQLVLVIPCSSLEDVQDELREKSVQTASPLA